MPNPANRQPKGSYPIHSPCTDCTDPCSSQTIEKSVKISAAFSQSDSFIIAKHSPFTTNISRWRTCTDQILTNGQLVSIGHRWNDNKFNSLYDQNDVAFHPGPVLPSVQLMAPPDVQWLEKWNMCPRILNRVTHVELPILALEGQYSGAYRA